ncbi:hypothetical protein MNBD_NITROSPINAE02-1891 [hydrothermal vent metagenome]|uniref:Uncharacterized protein n=1 Tax=hydrothermal vent metagenome TaxID=652676 RepID=A0A3B1CJ58_9ZZZZ
MIEAIGSVRKAAVGYGRQQFYADRAQKLNVTKSVQIGLQDRITLSPEAEVRIAQTAAPRPPEKSSRKAEIAYEDPRKSIPFEKRQQKASEPKPATANSQEASSD